MSASGSADNAGQESTDKKRSGTGGHRGGRGRGGKRRKANPELVDGECKIERSGIEGIVRMFNADKGWGFIDCDDGKDIFLHSKHIEGDVPSFWIGHRANTKDRDRSCFEPKAPVRVTFDLARSEDGKPLALKVQLQDVDKLFSAASASAEEHGRSGSDPPVCWRCGCSVATHLGMAFCVVCRTPAPSGPMYSA
mmetsp:Transcript_53324/g.152869  ORF Transcript_53324/g.152869 Transcript_53324/m.152869 type:complete len:194 (-) Transcript_53324:80-661(-)